MEASPSQGKKGTHIRQRHHYSFTPRMARIDPFKAKKPPDCIFTDGQGVFSINANESGEV